ncbi:MAG: ABC transporter ATP-binding protein [Rikenellaceae bacterium]|nr:ABC transporter ATP-binding protein [Rikenellaceae bacterium]
MNLITVENVSKSYTGHKALSDVSLSIPRGSIYGLLGPNGAGKTTLIRIINRITAPDSGRILFDGHDLEPEDVRRIGYLPEERGLYKKMKVGEQALYLAMLKGMSKKEATARLKEWFIRFDIKEWWNKKVEELSKGMAQKVQFIVTVLHNPELLILDEPFSGFDPVNASLIREEILRLRGEGATVIFSTHNMSSVEEICDHITLINKSRNILTGPVDEIRRSHGGDMYDVDFKGSAAEVSGRLEGLCSVLERQDDGTGYGKLKLGIEDCGKVRRVVEVINEAVELRTFREIIPSMNDIFIKAVSEESASSNNE